MKLLANSVLALLLILAGAFSYIWYQTNQSVHSAVKSVAPYAQVSYGSIISSIYPGMLGLADVTILLEGKRLHADAITVSADNIFDLYQLQQNPALYLVKHPRLEIRGLTSPVPLRKLQLLANPFDHPMMNTLMTLDAVGCGKRKEISFKDLYDMGYSSIKSDIALQSGPEAFGSGWTMTASSKTAGLADYSMSVNYADAPSNLPLALERLERLDVSKIVIQVRDRGYNPRLQQFCAEQLAMDAETYKRHHLRNLASSLRKRSMVMDDTMLGNYEESLNRGARLRLQVQPQPDFSIDDFGYYRPVDYPDLLGVRLAANNMPVSKSPAAAITPEAEHTEATAAIDPADKPAQPHRERDNTLEWSDLEQALHQDILVYTQSGGVHRGRLENVDNYLLVLKKTIGAGSMSYTIDKRRFARAELIKPLDSQSRVSAF